MVQVRKLIGIQTGEKREYECRLCGTSVSSETARCPECDFSGIGSYAIR